MKKYTCERKYREKITVVRKNIIKKSIAGEKN